MRFALVLLIACGPRAARPTQIGGGYTYAYRTAELGVGHGARFEAVFPRERWQPRLSVAVAKHTINDEAAAVIDTKIDWFVNRPRVDEGFVFDVGLGFGWMHCRGADVDASGPSVHGVIEVEYRFFNWSIVTNATPEGVWLGGLSSADVPENVGGIPVFVGVRGAVD